MEIEDLDPNDPDNLGVVLRVEHDGLLVLFVRSSADTGDHIHMTRMDPELRGEGHGDNQPDLIFAIPERIIKKVEEIGGSVRFARSLTLAAIEAIHMELDERDNE